MEHRKPASAPRAALSSVTHATEAAAQKAARDLRKEIAKPAHRHHGKAVVVAQVATGWSVSIVDRGDEPAPATPEPPAPKPAGKAASEETV